MSMSGHCKSSGEKKIALNSYLHFIHRTGVFYLALPKTKQLDWFKKTCGCRLLPFSRENSWTRDYIHWSKDILVHDNQTLPNWTTLLYNIIYTIKFLTCLDPHQDKTPVCLFEAHNRFSNKLLMGLQQKNSKVYCYCFTHLCVVLTRNLY